MSLAVNANYYGAGAGVDGYKANAKFIPDVWSGKLAVKFYAATCMSSITNSDWEGEIKDTGDKVIIRRAPSITINNYQKGMALASQVPTSTPLELNIDKGKYFQVVVDDVDTVQSDVKLMNMFTDDAAEQMKINIERDFFADVFAGAATANKGNTAGAISANLVLGTSAAPVTLTKTNVVDYLIDMGLALDEQNVPESGRWAVIPAAMAARIKKSELKDASLSGDGTSMLRNGRLGVIDRFTLYSSNNLSVTTGRYNIMAGTRDAISWAAQITKMETLRAQTTFGNLVRGLNVYGYAVTSPEALVHGVVQMG
jgi:hypothetical protein